MDALYVVVNVGTPGYPLYWDASLLCWDTVKAHATRYVEARAKQVAADLSKERGGQITAIDQVPS